MAMPDFVFLANYLDYQGWGPLGTNQLTKQNHWKNRHIFQALFIIWL